MSNAPYRSLRARLEAKDPRSVDRPRDPIAHASSTPLGITRAHEVSALAVGLLILQHVEDVGRTRLQEQAIQTALKQVTDHLDAAQMMRLEVEAYEIVDWLVGGDRGGRSPSFIAHKSDEGSVVYDPSATIRDMVREAVSQSFDLAITYYSSKRMELTTRVISPRAIAAEIYVRAWCHTRKAERIFRMGRIRSAVPVNGTAIQNPYFEHAISEQDAAQQSIELQSLSMGQEAPETTDTKSPNAKPDAPKDKPTASNKPPQKPADARAPAGEPPKKPANDDQLSFF